MTPIQAKSLPDILKGHDIQAQAKTGSGKTAAFALGILHHLDVKNNQTQALILCPTRELADQVSKEIRRLARSIPNTKVLTLCGGTAIGPQYASLGQHPPHIVVGTPGRVLKHCQKGSLKINSINSLVLDEGDRMLDMGFHEDIMLIIDNTPTTRQTLLFSATLSDEVKTISESIQKDPIDVQVESIHDNAKIKPLFYEVQKGQRFKILITLLQQHNIESCIIFCSRKQQCSELAESLRNTGFHALALHGDLEQRERDQVLVQFSNQSCSILVATDVAGRGLDIKDLPVVINYELSPDPEIHIHRIGRTGRAGNEGLAISLFSSSEVNRVRAIEDYLHTKISITEPSRLNIDKHYQLDPPMVTLWINGGRKNKVRAGDILGAITKTSDIPGTAIGKIDIFDQSAYIAIEKSRAKQALKVLTEGRVKGKRFKVSLLR